MTRAVPLPSLVALAVVAALWVACGGESPPSGTPPSPQPTSTAGVIEGQAFLGDADTHTGILIYCAGSNHIAFTDAEGHFAFSDLPFGSHELAARHEGYTQQMIGQIEITSESPHAIAPTVTLSRTPPDVVTLLPPSRGSLAGRALRSGSDDHEGIVVALEGTSVRTVTDASGRWLLHEIEPGEHRLRFTARGHSPVSIQGTVEPNRLLEVPPIVLEPLATADEPVRRIVGNVALVGSDGELVEDHSDVLVVLEGTDHTVVPDPEGRFEIRGLEPGIYRLSARAQGYRPAETQIVDLTVEPLYETTIFLDSEAVELPSLGEITGSVVLSDGGDPRGVAVGVPGTSHTALTGGGGRFLLAGVPEGMVDLIAQADEYEVLEVPQIPIVAGETTDVGTLRLQRRIDPPRVIVTDPREGERDVLLERQIPVFIRFSDEMDIASVRGAVRLEPRVPFTTLMGREHPETDYDLLLVLLPGGVGGIDFRDRVHIRIGPQAQSVEGVSMAEPFDLRFTMGQPALYSSNPPDGATAHPHSQPITLRFNAPLRTEEIANAFTFSPTPPTVPSISTEIDPETGWSTVRISVRLSPNQSYTLRLSRSLRTDTGQRLGGRREIRFRTAPEMVIDHNGQPVPRDDSVLY